MKSNEEIQSMEELIKELNRYSYEYYVLDIPSISDKEYDVKYNQLLSLEAETGVILPNSPTQRIGDVVLPNFEKYTHKAKLWSLDKAQSFEEVIAWHNKNVNFRNEYNRTHTDKLPPLSYVVTKKFDGLTINSTYDENGDILNTATRGTGEIGENVSEQAKTIINLPHKIENDFMFEIHGEALMTKRAFEDYNSSIAKNESPLKNLRNGAAGALRNLNVKETARRKLITYMYDIGYSKNHNFKTYTEMLDFIKTKGFPTAEYKIANTLEEMFDCINEIEDVRPDLQFDIDGAVIVINDIKTRELMGYTIKFPKWGIAYKFEAEQTSTTLLNVEWNTGRTGKVTPRAIVEPVDLMGTTVSYATLNNMDDIQRKNVKIGGRVFIRRSNDVIPEILSNADDNGTEILPPTHCSTCGTPLIKEGVHYFCPNTLGCKAQLVKSIVHFCEREAMNIEGFSEKTAEQFLDNGIINSIIDLFHLEDKKSEILKLGKFGLKKYNNLIDSVNKARTCKLHQLIFGLGIENVGIKTSKDLAKTFKTIHNLAFTNVNELLKVEDIGDIVATSIFDWFNTDKNIKLLKLLLEEITIEEEIEIDNSQIKENPLLGKSVYPTGKFRLKKDELKKKLESLGVIVETGYKKSLDYLICGGDTSKSGKVAKAISDNVPLMTEEELMKILNS